MRIEANMHQAKTDLSKLVAKAWEGDEVIIMRNGKPVAKLIPYAEGKRILGQARGQVWMAPDFDELPEEILRAFYGFDEHEELPEWLKPQGADEK